MTIEGERREDVIVVRVLDTGEGISPEAQQRLFEPLVTTKPLGLGLGLVTARTLIEGQGGTLRFRAHAEWRVLRGDAPDRVGAISASARGRAGSSDARGRSRGRHA